MKEILQVVVGSTAHGIAVDDGLEDLDLMSVVIEDPSDRIGFELQESWVTRTQPEGKRSMAGDVDHVTYGLRKFLMLALKSNPSILLAFFVPDGEHTRVLTVEGKGLRSLAPHIVSQRAFHAFKGYMTQQHSRLMGESGQKRCKRPELVERHGFDTKYAGHIVRLGLQGEEILRTGRLTIPMHPNKRALVLSVRNGELDLTQVGQLVQGLERRIHTAFKKTELPEEPDYARVQEWMIHTYLNEWHTHVEEEVPHDIMRGFPSKWVVDPNWICKKCGATSLQFRAGSTIHGCSRCKVIETVREPVPGNYFRRT